MSERLKFSSLNRLFILFVNQHRALRLQIILNDIPSKPFFLLLNNRLNVLHRKLSQKLFGIENYLTDRGRPHIVELYSKTAISITHIAAVFHSKFKQEVSLR